jgi:hypothetical protein
LRPLRSIGYVRAQDADNIPYELSFTERMAMKTAQKNCCALCHEPSQQLAVDHDHTTGRVRKLLCRQCNLGLGCFQDSTELLMAAISYLAEAAQEEAPQRRSSVRHQVECAVCRSVFDLTPDAGSWLCLRCKRAVDAFMSIDHARRVLSYIVDREDRAHVGEVDRVAVDARRASDCLDEDAVRY